MAVHHIALSTHNTEETHAFYTEAMGFRLAKVVAGETEHGWSKHLFYDTGDGGFIAFWELHDPSIDDYRSDVSTGIGLPIWVNHLAFTAENEEALVAAKARWLDYGVPVADINHGWCRSIYTTDPNGIMVEWCTMLRALDEHDEREALELLNDAAPPLEPPPAQSFEHPERPRAEVLARS